MAHWAELDENNVVIRTVVGNDDLPDEGYEWLMANLGGRWIKTSYNTRANQHLNGGVPLRGNYASEGMVYLPDVDVFVSPQPYPSWVLDHETYQWEAPVGKPSDTNEWRWEESVLDWVPISTD